MPFYLSSIAWNFALGMTYILVPLYARSLGMPGVEIGILVSAPVVLQMIFTLVGGALSDRVGGKNMAMASCFLTLVSALVFMAASGFAMMMAGQVLMVVSRAMFWPASWSLASQLPGDGPTQMGRFNGATNGGQIAGTAGAGFIIAAAGYLAGFGVMAVFALAALLLGPAYRTAAHRPRKQDGNMLGNMFATYRRLAGMRSIRYSVLCAYISALPVSLAFSFYPILLVEQGFASDMTGSLISLRGVGAVVAGFLAGYLGRNVQAISMPMASAIILGFSVALGAAVSQPWLIGLFLFLVGVASSLVTLYFQMLISLISTRETRGSAMALGGLGWSISHLTTPFAMGLLKDALDIRIAFYLVGGFAVLCGLSLAPAYRWAFAREPLKDRVEAPL
ncbi:MAG: MFS transporter [Noviherbaspirillum sp.]